MKFSLKTTVLIQLNASLDQKPNKPIETLLNVAFIFIDSMYN